MCFLFLLFHQYHAPSAGIGAGTLFFIILSLAVSCMIYKKFCWKKKFGAKNPPTGLTSIQIGAPRERSSNADPHYPQYPAYPANFPPHALPPHAL